MSGIANEMPTSLQEMPSGESGRYGVPLEELLQTPSLSNAKVVAGAAGLSRLVARLNVMEVPDTVPALIGQLPLEHLDLVVDLRSRTLIGNPAHGGEHVYELY